MLGRKREERGQVGNKNSALLHKYFLSISVNMTNIGCTRTRIKVKSNNLVLAPEILLVLVNGFTLHRAES